MTGTQMYRDITDQPEAVARTVAALQPLGSEIRRLAGSRRQVVFFARGTSDNAATYGQYLCSTRGHYLATLGSPSLATQYRAQVDLRDVLAVGVSQSGETEEILECLTWAAGQGARTIAVTNARESPLAKAADLALVTEAGVERAIPATKTYTTQLAALAVMALSLAEDMADFDDLEGIPEHMSAALRVAPDAQRLASRLAGADKLVVSARGYALSTAREVALKLQEACYITAVGSSYADLLHGPLAIVDSRTPVLLVAAMHDTAVLPGMTEFAMRCSDVGAPVYGIGGDARFARACTAGHLPGPECAGDVAAIPLVVPGQLLTEALARVKGVDPDAPRSLSKVTQTI